MLFGDPLLLVAVPRSLALAPALSKHGSELSWPRRSGRRPPSPLSWASPLVERGTAFFLALELPELTPSQGHTSF